MSTTDDRVAAEIEDFLTATAAEYYADQGAPAPEAEGESAPETGRRIKLTKASSITMRPVWWTWEDRIPAGSLTVVPGREGIGKSLLLAWLTAQITTGKLPGLHNGKPRPVIYAATEDSWAHTIGPRLFAAGADMDMVYRVDVVHGDQVDQLTLPVDCDALAVEIKALGVALLAADPLLSLIHSAIDTHQDRKLRTALEPLVKLADETGCAVVGLAHFNKSASTDALNLITGSRAFSAVARAVIAMARDTDADDGSCVMSQAKSNLGRLDLPSLRYIVESAEVPTPEGPAYVGKLTFTGESERSVSDILGEAGDGGATETRAERDEAAEWLHGYLLSNGGEAPWSDIRKASRADGFAERTMQRARAKAGATAQREGFPAKTVWRLATTAKATAEETDETAQSRQSRQSRQQNETRTGAAPLAPLTDSATTQSDPGPSRE